MILPAEMLYMRTGISKASVQEVFSCFIRKIPKRMQGISITHNLQVIYLESYRQIMYNMNYDDRKGWPYV
ncbi:hypothetical protein HNR53_000215 [Bacillus benzoevorans]|uniref:Uncharacterized protein n=1 Tax=Bacillus benzoevorans TaxID=1456 RepID=A0A7X0HPZ1_9BACI|nr:hypothetical protein [Bacillus benzoevorans]